MVKGESPLQVLLVTRFSLCGHLAFIGNGADNITCIIGTLLRMYMCLCVHLYVCKVQTPEGDNLVYTTGKTLA